MPLTRVPPNGLICSVFTPLEFNAPATTIWSLPEAGVVERSKTIVLPPFKARLLLKVNVPTVPFVAGAIRLLAAEKFPATAPTPEKVWPLDKPNPLIAETSKVEAALLKTIAGVLEIEPLAPRASVPPMMTVAPE